MTEYHANYSIVTIPTFPAASRPNIKILVGVGLRLERSLAEVFPIFAINEKCCEEARDASREVPLL